MGAFAQSGSTGTFATLVASGITYTAVTMGTAGNSITIALVAGGTAGSEVVTVTGNAISVSIQSGTSTRTQVKTAIDASAAAAALIGVSVTSGATAATPVAATSLATGTSTTITSNAPINTMTLTQIGTGVWQIQLADAFPNLISCNIMIQKASAADMAAQIQSVNIAFGTSKRIIFRTQAGATPTNLASGDIMYIDVNLRNSANPA